MHVRPKEYLATVGAEARAVDACLDSMRGGLVALQGGLLHVPPGALQRTGVPPPEVDFDAMQAVRMLPCMDFDAYLHA